MAELIIPAQLRARHREGLALAIATDTTQLLGVASRSSRCGVMVRNSRRVGDHPHRRWKRGPALRRSYRDITERRRFEQRQAARSSVALVLAAATTLAEAAPRILEAVCERLNWDFGALWGENAGALHCVEVWHSPAAHLGEFAAATRRGPSRKAKVCRGEFGVRLCQSGFPTSRSTPISPAPRSPHAVDCTVLSDSPFASARRCSVRVEFFSRKIRQPDEKLLEMFAGIGAQIGQFIERRRAEADLRALNLELETRVHDRTRELGEANVRLLTALENEQEVGRLKSSFVSLVSHEFRTPFGMILSSSEVLNRYFAALEEPRAARAPGHNQERRPAHVGLDGGGALFQPRRGG